MLSGRNICVYLEKSGNRQPNGSGKKTPIRPDFDMIGGVVRPLRRRDHKRSPGDIAVYKLPVGSHHQIGIKTILFFVFRHVILVL